MRSYEASSLINATPAQVWPLLTDTAAWSDWDSGVTKVDGRLVRVGFPEASDVSPEVRV